jgi:hypothetical protein
MFLCCIIAENLKLYKMKITIKEDGSLKIDGEHSTVIYAEIESGIGIKTQGNNAHFYTDFIKIEGDKPEMRHEISNFIFQSKSSEYQFGEEITIGNEKLQFIGVDRYGNKILWNPNKKELLLGYTEAEVDHLKSPLKKGLIDTLFGF